jgi:hypothetical protein
MKSASQNAKPTPFPERLQAWDPDPEFVVRAPAFVTARYSEFPGATIAGDTRVPVFQSTKTGVLRRPVSSSDRAG